MDAHLFSFLASFLSWFVPLLNDHSLPIQRNLCSLSLVDAVQFVGKLGVYPTRRSPGTVYVMWQQLKRFMKVLSVDNTLKTEAALQFGKSFIVCSLGATAPTRQKLDMRTIELQCLCYKFVARLWRQNPGLLSMLFYCLHSVGLVPYSQCKYKKWTNRIIIELVGTMQSKVLGWS